MTEYVILRGTVGADPELPVGSEWELFTNTAASSARRALASLDVDAGVYVAVPARSWKPLTVKVETSRKLTIK